MTGKEFSNLSPRAMEKIILSALAGANADQRKLVRRAKKMKAVPHQKKR